MADHPILAAIRKPLHRHDWSRWEARTIVDEVECRDGSRIQVIVGEPWWRECATCGKRESGNGYMPLS